MGKGIDKLKQILQLNGDDDDDDYDTDDLFDSEIDLVEPKPKKEPQPARTERPERIVKSSAQSKPMGSAGRQSSVPTGSLSRASAASEPSADSAYRRPAPKAQRPAAVSTANKVVSMNRGNQVIVIRPNGLDETQTITDFLKEGKAVVINLEGIEMNTAQRIIDFIGGACYAMEGSLQAVSNNMFIAAPPSVDVSGDLREEFLLGDVSPNMGNY